MKSMGLAVLMAGPTPMGMSRAAFRRLCFFCLATLLGWIHPQAWAHRPSDSYLTVQIEKNEGQVRWDVSIRDFDLLLGLDNNNDSTIIWAELQESSTKIWDEAKASLIISLGDAKCLLTPNGFQVATYSDENYVSLKFLMDCPSWDSPLLGLSYRLLFEENPRHRALVSILSGKASFSAVMSPERAKQTFFLNGHPTSTTISTFARMGVDHIMGGFDHIAFLLALILPSVLQKKQSSWVPHESVMAAGLGIIGITTAFTLAHSVTLALTVLGYIQLPGYYVESAIAVSVILASMDNLFSIFKFQRWKLAFSFGLVHGVGFADILSGMNLPTTDLLLALACFNVGVEIGQIFILVSFYCITWWTRRKWWYFKWVFQGGSVLISIFGLFWLIDRLFGFDRF